jgi:hypothetical protein
MIIVPVDGSEWDIVLQYSYRKRLNRTWGTGAKVALRARTFAKFVRTFLSLWEFCFKMIGVLYDLFEYHTGGLRICEKKGTVVGPLCQFTVVPS